MQFEFESNVIPIVQRKKKYQNFTVVEIKDIEAFRKNQAKVEEAYLNACSARGARMAAFRAASPDGVDSPTLSRPDWKQRYQEAMDRQKSFHQIEYPAPHSYVPDPEPTLTLIQKCKRWISSVWEAANP